MPTHVYDQTATHPVKEIEVEYLRHGDTPFLATVFQPQGDGPFPMIVSAHGGAWNGGKRPEPALINRELAASGMVVASVDFRLAPRHPYPAQVQDVHYAVRWLKAHAPEFNGDPETVGILGASSGGHTSLLSALRPHDPRYAALPLEGPPGMDATVQFVICCWSVIDPWVRYEFARTTPAAGEGYGGAETKVRQTLNYFLNEAAMHEGNPQEILERGEAQALPPVLIIQGTEDMNIPLTLPQRFSPAYRAAGGSARVEWFPGQPHGFGNRPGPDSARAIAVMKEFVASCVGQPVPA